MVPGPAWSHPSTRLAANARGWKQARRWHQQNRQTVDRGRGPALVHTSKSRQWASAERAVWQILALENTQPQVAAKV